MARFHYPFPPRKYVFPIGMIISFVLSYLTFRSGDSLLVFSLALFFLLTGLQELAALIITLNCAPESLTVEPTDIRCEMVGERTVVLTPGSVSTVLHSGWLEVLCGYTTVLKTNDPKFKRLFLSMTLVGFADFFRELRSQNPNVTFTGEQL